MKPAISLLLAALLVVSLAGMAGVAMAQEESSDEEIQPGEHITAVINVGHAEIEGEIAERGFGISVADAASEDAKAELIAAQITDVDERLDALEARQQALDEARAAGEISEGRYAAEVARLQSERATAERLAKQSMTVAVDLPQGVNDAHGISVQLIEELRERADALSGEDVAAFAQDIASPNVADPLPDVTEDDKVEEEIADEEVDNNQTDT